MLKHLILDLGGVLINFDPTDYIKTLGLDEDTSLLLKQSICSDPLWGEMDYGVYPTPQDYVPLFIAHYPSLKEEIISFFNGPWMESIYTPLLSNLSLLDYAQDHHLDYYILSNFSMDGTAFLKSHYDFIKNAKGSLFSSDIKMRKPNKNMFELFFKTFKLNKEECLFIDDFKENINMASTLAIPTHLFKDIHETIDYLNQYLK